MTQAVFPDLGAAMKFLAEFRHDGQARPAMNKASEAKVIGYEDTQRITLTGPNGATQRAFLMDTLAQMPRLYMHVLLARYTPMRDSCPCCAQQVYSQPWIGLVQAISDDALRLEVVNNHTALRQGRDGAVARYFGDESSTLAEIADRAEISLRTMNTMNARIRGWLGGTRVERRGTETVKGRVGVEQHALRLADTLLSKHGHIERTRYV